MHQLGTVSGARLLTLLSVTVNTEGSCTRGPRVAVLMGEGRAEPPCRWYLPADITGVPAVGGPAAHQAPHHHLPRFSSGHRMLA